MRTGDLTGPLLDYWVGKADNKKVRIIPSGSYPYDDRETEIFFHGEADGYLYPGTIGLSTSDTIPEYSPSTNWSQGGTIIEWEKIAYEPNPGGRNVWSACCGNLDKDPILQWVGGDTLLVSAMRAFVTSKFGEEVDE
ncbi:MAG: DUF2591 family protein [Candidatus Vecturithrix sp.]|jgi:hypothetical protein|nr:DUF2591 family protein [Candidatus Vecturithrix sp.]